MRGEFGKIVEILIICPFMNDSVLLEAFNFSGTLLRQAMANLHQLNGSKVRIPPPLPPSRHYFRLPRNPTHQIESKIARLELNAMPLC